MYDVIIVGAGCAGMTAAVYAARAGKSALVLEGESVGGQISYSPRVENYPGITKISGAEFSNTLFEQMLSFGVEFELEAVTALKPGNEYHTVVTEKREYLAKNVIIATGVKHKKLGAPREDELSGISYCAICDGAFYKGKTVAVIGGGNSALQSAEYLACYCEKVYLIHRRDEFRAENEQVKAITGIDNIEFILNSNVFELCGEEELNAVVVKNNLDGSIKKISVEGLFVCIGQIPENAVFADVISLDCDGFIDADEDCKSNIPWIFAAGDCRKKNIRQLTTAAADGTVAALNCR